MQNSPNHKGGIGDFARSALTQCNLTSLEASLELEHRKIALVDEILFRNRPCSISKSWAISLEHGSGTPKWPRPLFPFAGERFYCRFGESSSRKDETQFLQSIFVKKNLLKSSSNHIWLCVCAARKARGARRTDAEPEEPDVHTRTGLTVRAAAEPMD